MTEKYYQLGTHTAEQYHEIHDLLCSATDGVENIPNRACTCHNDLAHSPTRGSYILTDEEATALKADSRIKFINIDYVMYPETYAPPPEEIQASSPDLLNRYSSSVKLYREFENSGTLPGGTPDSTEVNRASWSLIRHGQKLDRWVDESRADNYILEAVPQQYGDGADVDVIVADDGGGWIGHPEFQNNCTDAPAPDGYTGGNVLPGNGTCDVLDLVLDAPYYLDPDYFDADAGNRLTTRWDGTTVPVESFARNWWSSTSSRSDTFNSKYPNAGTTTSITTSYTRSYCNGSNTAQSSVGTHCTPCMALTYGRTQGWAYNANKWVLNLYGTNGSDIERGFDIQKIFHNVKPVNAKYGTQDPTVSSNSWGYRSNKAPGALDSPSSTLYYFFRGGDATSYTTETGIDWLSHMGITGDGGRWKSEMKTNSTTTALDELCESGVIMVCAAGNSNQKQVNWDHQDFNNYIAGTPLDSLEDSSFTEFGLSVTGTTNRRGVPQQGGKSLINQATYTFNATAPAGTAYYRIVGTDRTGAIDYNNGPITVRTGDTIELTNDTDSSHTMFIKTSDTVGPSDQVSGATGQGAYGGSTITWTPTEIGTYYYKCLNHSNMGGEIVVTQGEIEYKTINIGALDDEYATGNLERKVNYSDRGNGIDAYFAADGTLAANRAYTSEGQYPSTYPGFTANSGSGSGIPEDCAFGGTSAACPVGAGFIATLVGLNRNWTYANVKTYLNGLENQAAADFYYGTESTSPTDSNWNDYNSLEGGDAKVGYQDISQLTQTTLPKRAANIGTGLNIGAGISITRVNRFDRGR
jgi:plastocyanin